MDFSTFLLSKSYTDKKIQEAIGLGFKVEVKSNRDILQTTGEDKILYLLPKTNTDTKDEYDEYVYVNNDWEWIGHTVIDLSSYALKTEIPDISGKYEKPSSGIPKTDLDSSVQSSLGKADTALQSHQDISGKANVATTIAGYGITDAYTKTEINTMIGDIETLLQGV